MPTITAKNFSLKATLESGQIFRWEQQGEWHYIVTGKNIIRIRQDEERISYQCSSDDFDVQKFLGLKDSSYEKTLAEISRHRQLKSAAAKYKGLRIMQQEPWECTASFICSSFSNIKRITKNLNAIASKFGKQIKLEGYASYAFPTAAEIAANPAKLKGCGLGYREKYLAETAQKISSGWSYSRIRRKSYEQAKKQLMKLPGVGEKVADCIMLFSLGFTEAFPVDTWIGKAMKQEHAECRAMSAKKTAEYGRKLFGKNAGYAQQFIYHYARSCGGK